MTLLDWGADADPVDLRDGEYTGRIVPDPAGEGVFLCKPGDDAGLRWATAARPDFVGLLEGTPGFSSGILFDPAARFELRYGARGLSFACPCGRAVASPDVGGEVSHALLLPGRRLLLVRHQVLELWEITPAR